MNRSALNPKSVLDECGTADPLDFVRLGVSAARGEDYERGLIFLAEAYNRMPREGELKFPPVALSYYGLCLGLHKSRMKEAMEFCQLALSKELFNADLYANQARVLLAANQTKKAIEAIDRGLAVDGRNAGLMRLRRSLGVRKRPVLPFLHRDNPLNVALGKARTKMGKKSKSR